MDASYAQVSFLGGAWSKTMQGRFDRPDYRIAMNVCLNGLPIDTGAWTRRPGSRVAATTRSGNAGRVISFNFKEMTPYKMEFTTGMLRFRVGADLVMTNDAQAVVSISTANPAKVATAAHGWATGNQVAFSALGVNNPLLHNRLFTATVTSATEFTLTDAITGAAIDGATLGTFVSGTVSRVYEIATPYVTTLWQNVRMVQSDRQGTNGSTVDGVFLHPGIKPNVLSVATQPTAAAFATFTFGPANFKDGPYFDPVPGGTLATPSALIGNITLNLSFAAYDAARSYAIGDYVTSAAVNYKSLTDANIGNAPAISPGNWVAVSAADAISPTGFSGSDIGRHVRMYSEPALWVIGTPYVVGNVVAYQTGIGGGFAYYTCLANHTATLALAPGVSLASWGVNARGALWTWGVITALSNIIDRALAGSASIGNMTSGGGLAALFDGIISQAASASAEKVTTGTMGKNDLITVSSYGGKNYSGATDQAIAQATAYPSSDKGLAFGTVTVSGTPTPLTIVSVTLNLRGKATLPASASDGTLLGTSGAIANTTAPVTVVSSDIVTAWKYVWFEEIVVATIDHGPPSGMSYSLTTAIGELSFFSPAGSGVSQGVTVQIRGPALLYTTPIRVWRLGLFSDTTGWPSCGTYHEGRLWLSGVVGNRIDGSVANDIYNFAPTQSDGTVTDANAIAYAFNAPDVNTIFWMVPDQQGIIVGTQAGEWLVQASNLNSPLTPTSMQAHRVTKIGCANIEPRRTDHTTVFIQKHKQKAMEYFADVFSGKFSAPNLALTAKHFAARGFEEIAYQQELAPVLWARCSDGSLIGATYKRDSLTSSQGPTYAGWHEHALGSGRTVESICTGPSTGGLLDTLAMVTNASATGIRHVEFLTNLWAEGSALATAWQLDDAVTPSATQTVTVAGTSVFQLLGLWHLVGATVQVFAGGLDLGDYVVAADGTIDVPFGSAGGLFTTAFVASFAAGIPVVAGFTYTSRGQLLRPATPQDSGARNGPAFGKTRRNQPAMALLQDTQGIYIGTDFSTIKLAQLRTDSGGVALTPLQLKSGIWRDTIGDNYSYDGMLAWEVRRPYPATVVVMGALIQTQDA